MGTLAAVALQSPRAIAAALQIRGVVGTLAAVAVQSPRAMAAALQIRGVVGAAAPPVGEPPVTRVREPLISVQTWPAG